jgi:hypothetical protein
MAGDHDPVGSRRRVVEQQDDLGPARLGVGERGEVAAVPQHQLELAGIDGLVLVETLVERQPEQPPGDVDRGGDEVRSCRAAGS